jgi:hypothetical protein
MELVIVIHSFGGNSMKRKSKAKPIRKAPAKVAAVPKPAGVQIVAAAAAAMKGIGTYNNPKLTSPMVSFRLTPALKAALLQLAATAEGWRLNSIGKQIKNACRAYVLTDENKKRLPAAIADALTRDTGRGYGY